MTVSFISPALYLVLNLGICVVYPGIKTFIYLYGRHLPAKDEGAEGVMYHPAVYAHHIFYWTIYFIYSTIESLFLSGILHLMPFFHEMKLTLFYWLGSDHFKGAGYLFQRFCMRYVLSGGRMFKKYFNEKLDKKSKTAIMEFLKKLGKIDDLKIFGPSKDGL